MRLLDRFDDPVAIRVASGKNRPTRITFVGDSNLATLKHALEAGPEGSEGYDVSFYGAAGPSFRALRYANGLISPAPSAFDAVRLVTGGESVVFDPAESDIVVFFAARLRIQDYFDEFLHRKYAPASAVSAQLRARVLEHLVVSARFARAAFRMAAGGHRVIFAPTPFLTDEVAGDPLSRRPFAAHGTAADRAALWDEVEAYFTARGVDLLRQPDHTVVRGCLTDPRYAVANAWEVRDAVHKNPAYGAIVLRQVFAALERGEKSAK